MGLNSHTGKFRSGEPPHSRPFFIIIICKKTRGKNEKKIRLRIKDLEFLSRKIKITTTFCLFRE